MKFPRKILKLRPSMFLVIYAIVIVMFAIFYTIIDQDFYHSTARYENYSTETYEEIKNAISTSIREKFYETHSHDSVYLDTNETWIFNIENLELTYIELGENDFKISFYCYITNIGTQYEADDDTTGFVQTSARFDLNFAGSAIFNDEEEIQTFLFDLVDDEKINLTDLGYDDYNLLKIFNQNESPVIKVELPYKYSRLIQAYIAGNEGFPSAVDGSFMRMLYLSMVTITTLGYGDIVPLTNVARIAVGLEAVVGIVIIGWFANSLFERIKETRNI